MKYFFLIAFTILITILSNSCSNKKDKLIVEEIFISKHNVGPPSLGETIYFTPPGTKPPKNWEAKPDTLFEFCIKGNLISHSSHNPRLIIKVDQAEEMIGYIKNCFKQKEGYFKFMLSDSLLNYVNRQIEKMNYTKLNTLYSEESDGGIYDGPEYFLSIKKDSDEKQVLIMNKYKAPTNIIRFIDSL